MHPITGAIHEFETEEELHKKERELKTKLLPIAGEHLGKVRGLSLDERKAFMKRVERNRKKRAKAKKSKRKNRG